MAHTLLACLFALSLMVTAGSDHSNHTATRAARSATINLNAGVDKVFPLFGFLEEKKWSLGWDPKVVAMGNSLQDSVFTYTHDHVTATWIVTEYDESRHRVTYAVFVPNNRAMTIRIECSGDQAHTRADIAYSFTVLGEQGEASFREFQQQDFAHRLLHWQHAINHYLETGTQWQGDSN